MIQQLLEKVSNECIMQIADAVPQKTKYTMRDVKRLQIESLFHRWECGTLPGQDGLCSYVLALVVALKRDRVSEAVRRNAEEYAENVYEAKNIFD